MLGKKLGIGAVRLKWPGFKWNEQMFDYETEYAIMVEVEGEDQKSLLRHAVRCPVRVCIKEAVTEPVVDSAGNQYYRRTFDTDVDEEWDEEQHDYGTWNYYPVVKVIRKAKYDDTDIDPVDMAERLIDWLKEKRRQQLKLADAIEAGLSEELG